MIDFRYYLVSIVSIFLALTVGIVLGAGPLKGDIGASLTKQMTALRVEKIQLRTDLDAANRNAAARDSFASAVAPSVVKDRLTGKTVALVVAPGVDADLIKNATTALVGAGAKVGSTVTLNDSWADPSQITLRNTVASPYATLAGAPSQASSPELAATLLARVILGGTDHSTGRLTPSASAALNGLKAGGLINISTDLVLPSSGVVFLSGSVKGSTQQDIDARTAAYVQLLRSLDISGSGVVVVAKTNTTDETKSVDLVAAVRKNADAFKAISTVDDADLPMGLGTIVLALAQQYGGGTGQYGLAGDAKAVAPDLTVKQ